MIPFGATWGTNDAGVAELCQDLLDEDVRLRKEKVENFLQHRKRVIRRIIAVAGSSAEKDARAAAMYLLGKMRAVAAADVLVTHIAFEAVPIPPRHGPLERVGRYGAQPAIDALRAIGRPCTTRLIEEVEKADPTIAAPGNPQVRNSRHAHWLLMDMYSLDELERLLTERLKRTTDDQKRKHLNAFLRVVKKDGSAK